MLMTVWFCMNSKTPSLAITMKGVSPLMRPEATSGSAVTPILSAAAQAKHHYRRLNLSPCTHHLPAGTNPLSF